MAEFEEYRYFPPFCHQKLQHLSHTLQQLNNLFPEPWLEALQVLIWLASKDHTPSNLLPEVTPTAIASGKCGDVTAHQLPYARRLLQILNTPRAMPPVRLIRLSNMTQNEGNNGYRLANAGRKLIHQLTEEHTP